MPPAETYRDQLMHRGYGYPLWEPNPRGAAPVELADVGYIEHGKFYKLFNARLLLGDPTNQRGAPSGHIPLLVEDDTLDPIPCLPFYISSQTSSEAGADMSLTASAPTPQGQVGGGGSFSLSRSKETGALLCMKTSAERQEVLDKKNVQDYALAHYKSWHKFALDLGRDVGLEELRIVTGCDKTSDWACAAWSSSSSSGSIGFNADSPVVQGQAHIWGRWETSDSVDYHAGPPRLPEPEPDNSLLGRARSQITALVSNSRDSSTSATVFDKNQCVFVRGYIVAERFRLKRKIKTKAGEPFGIIEKPRFSISKTTSSSSTPSAGVSQGGLSSSITNTSISESQETTSAHSADAYTSDESDSSVQEHPISLTDAMIEYIFKKSEAKLALIHDEDVCHLFQNLSESLFRADYRQLVDERNPAVYMDGEVGMFSQSFATRYPSSGTDMIKCTTHSEHLEPQRSVPTQLQNQSLAPVVEERQTDAEQPEASLRAPGRKTTNETFIIVRPPPAKTNHPLNLQVQLVPSRTRRDKSPTNTPVPYVPLAFSSADQQNDQQIESTPSIATLVGTSSQSTTYSLTPTLVGSSRSTIYSSTPTMTSTSGGRMVIPLYNLQAHNIMTNTVVDAGTDDKVAKFQEPGLEIIGLAVLAPIEIWNEAPAIPSSRTSLDGEHGSPTSSISTSSFRRSPKLPKSGPRGAKKMIGKIFRKSKNRPPSSRTHPPSPHVSVSTQWSDLPASGQAPQIARPPVLGVRPSLDAPSYPRGRPNKYVWVVQRWTKGSDSSLLGGMMRIGKLTARGKDQLGVVSGLGQVEVQFEWTRGTTSATREKNVKRGRRVSGTGGGDTSATRRASSIDSRQSSREHLQAESLPKKDVHASSTSHRSGSTNDETSDDHQQTTANAQEDGGDESDPEDSETPWTCAVRVQRVAPSGAATDMPPSGHIVEDDQTICVEVATLSPTPHHPKVVSTFKVPFPLPDIELDNIAIREQVLTPQGIARPGIRKGQEDLVLTAVEIKDVIACTGLWLVIREGFGGIGKVRRKGDGWKIR